MNAVWTTSGGAQSPMIVAHRARTISTAAAPDTCSLRWTCYSILPQTLRRSWSLPSSLTKTRVSCPDVSRGSATGQNRPDSSPSLMRWGRGEPLRLCGQLILKWSCDVPLLLLITSGRLSVGRKMSSFAKQEVQLGLGILDLFLDLLSGFLQLVNLSQRRRQHVQP